MSRESSLPGRNRLSASSHSANSASTAPRASRAGVLGDEQLDVRSHRPEPMRTTSRAGRPGQETLRLGDRRRAEAAAAEASSNAKSPGCSSKYRVEAVADGDATAVAACFVEPTACCAARPTNAAKPSADASAARRRRIPRRCSFGRRALPRLSGDSTAPTVCGRDETAMRAGQETGRAGSEIQTSAPFPLGAMPAEPPCACATASTIARPSPLPPRVRASSPRANRSNARDATSCENPCPSSRTWISIASPTGRAVIVTSPRRIRARCRRGCGAPARAGACRPRPRCATVSRRRSAAGRPRRARRSGRPSSGRARRGRRARPAARAPPGPSGR